MQGSCLCGAVVWRVTGDARPVVACHCTQCRKSSGHYVAATQARDDQLETKGAENVTWFASSPGHQRGFCGRCGSQLFWMKTGSGLISIMAGSIDGESGLRMESQIHAQAKGDYYTLPDIPVIDQAELK